MRAISPVLATVLLAMGITWAAADEPPFGHCHQLAVADGLSGACDDRRTRAISQPTRSWPALRCLSLLRRGSLGGRRLHVVTRGKELGGKSVKFLCRTSEGRMLRLKSWDPERETGNREVFATVAATRLMWALGFDVLHALPINVRCTGCPRDP